MSPATTDPDEYWMRRALALAREGEVAGEVPVGAVVVRDGELLGEGVNRPISGCDPTAHAEIVALRDAAARVRNYRLPDTTLYVTVEPCTMCVGAIVHARVARVVFGAREPRAGVVVSRDHFFERSFLNHRVEAVGGVLADECGALISGFFAKKR